MTTNIKNSAVMTKKPLQLPSTKYSSNKFDSSIEDKTNDDSLTADKEKSPLRTTGAFRVGTINEYIKEAQTKPNPRRLFGDLFLEFDLSILFADSGLGKTWLALQIAEQIASGKAFSDTFPYELSEGQKVQFFDFEMNQKQIEMRYSKKGKITPYKFSNNLIRIELSSESELPNDVKNDEDWIFRSMDDLIKEENAKILIIDNITFLTDDLEKGKTALRLMKQFKKLKNKYDLSILLLAHTPKRDATKPLSRNDLGGSKMLYNALDGCFAIGESYNDIGMRYIKQLKTRLSEIRFDSSNVIPMTLTSDEKGFMYFDFNEPTNEGKYLKPLEKEEEETLRSNVVRLRGEKKKSYREIGKELGISYSKAKRIYDKHKKNGGKAHKSE